MQGETGVALGGMLIGHRLSSIRLPLNGATGAVLLLLNGWSRQRVPEARAALANRGFPHPPTLPPQAVRYGGVHVSRSGRILTIFSGLALVVVVMVVAAAWYYEALAKSGKQGNYREKEAGGGGINRGQAVAP